MADFSTDDLRAAVASGVLTEEQASRVAILADERRGYRDHMGGEDEPFELFKGFAEIFVAVGILILFAGVGAMTTLLWAIGWLSAVPLIGAGLAWLFAEYFTRNRRMSLPSILLTIIFGANVAGIAIVYLELPATIAMSALLTPDPQFLAGRFMAVAGAALFGMLVWYWRFRIPFTMLVAGIFGFGVILSGAAILDPSLIDLTQSPVQSLFNLGGSSNAALAMLVFGLIAFAIAMTFDLRDPHRISRLGRAAFWLHVLAAPALVNTTAYTLFSLGGSTGFALTAALLLFITLLALIIDRRSFLTAGLIYMAILLSLALDGTGTQWSGVLQLLILGSAVTLLGTFWTQARAILMRLLPNFPGKSRLPPYAARLTE